MIQIKDKGITIAIIGALAVIIAAILPIVCAKPSQPLVLRVFSGTVVDGATNDPIDHAEIMISGRNERYYTEGNGNFRFQIGDSTARIIIRKNGYHDYDQTYDLPSERNIIPLTK